jgi:thymidylate synthase
MSSVSLSIEQQYLNLVSQILEHGKWKQNRTGVRTLTIVHAMLNHDMSTGYPLLTTKKMPFRVMAVELEGFIKGVKDKRWFQQRNCHIWDEWCNPKKVPYGTDKETLAKMAAEPDLGPIYGVQWRNFNEENRADQLQMIVDTLKNDKYNRRMVCSAWNPLQLDQMALPPCHILWHVTALEDTLNLCWFQRSCDLMLGIPFNIASYALLLELLAKESGLKPGILTGFLSDVHIYENHIEGAKLQIQRIPKKIPTLKFKKFTSIFDWTYEDCELEGYEYYDKIQFDIVV